MSGQVRKPRTRVERNTGTHVDDDRNRRRAAAKQAAEELEDELDDLLDDIDDVLEENAEEFLKGYVQKGGQ